eukprot:COSAG06_NODE_17202_length_955_cov_0.933411_2_plen_54_part_01
MRSCPSTVAHDSVGTHDDDDDDDEALTNYLCDVMNCVALYVQGMGKVKEALKDA